MKKTASLFALLFIASAACAGESDHGKRSKGKPSQPTASAAASARSTSAAGAVAAGGAGGNSSATAAGGNAHAAGGDATATGGQVGNISVTTGGGLSGRMVPDVSTTSPITSTTCRNGITAGGSGNGWGGLIGFFSEDDACEWRLLEANYRATGDTDKANAIRSGMTAQRCAKLSPEDRDAFGGLCPAKPEAEKPSAAFSSAG